MILNALREASLRDFGWHEIATNLVHISDTGRKRRLPPPEVLTGRSLAPAQLTEAFSETSPIRLSGHVLKIVPTIMLFVTRRHLSAESAIELQRSSTHRSSVFRTLSLLWQRLVQPRAEAHRPWTQLSVRTSIGTRSVARWTHSTIACRPWQSHRSG